MTEKRLNCVPIINTSRNKLNNEVTQLNSGELLAMERPQELLNGFQITDIKN